jgi:hypothetical protein
MAFEAFSYEITRRDRLMKYEPFAKSLIATSLALSCLTAHAASVAPATG